MSKLDDWDKATKAKQKEQELYKADAVYRFLTNQIGSTDSEIRRVKRDQHLFLFSDYANQLHTLNTPFFPWFIHVVAAAGTW